MATTGGPLATESLDALAVEHTVVGVVRPRRSWRGRLRALVRGQALPDAVDEWCRAHRVPSVTVASRHDRRFVAVLEGARADLLCVATFPWILPPAVLGSPAAGVVNLHPALLPRHRGPNPLFWTYYHDDRETGITVHVADARADAGPVLSQRRCALPRGYPVEQLYLDLARRAGEACREALAGLADGTVRPQPQDEAAVTRAPGVRSGMPMVDFTAWGVERVWHFLAGLVPRFREPLTDERGRPVRYRSVTGFAQRDPLGPPGSVSRMPEGWDLWCRDGAVRLGGSDD